MVLPTSPCHAPSLPNGLNFSTLNRSVLGKAFLELPKCQISCIFVLGQSESVQTTFLLIQDFLVFMHLLANYHVASRRDFMIIIIIIIIT